MKKIILLLILQISIPLTAHNLAQVLYKAWQTKYPIKLSNNELTILRSFNVSNMNCYACNVVQSFNTIHNSEFNNMVHFWFQSQLDYKSSCDYIINEDEQFILMTSLYNETHPERLQEYIYCIQKNIEHPLIKTIHVLYDTNKDDNNNELLKILQEAGIIIEYIQGHPSYGDFFNRANTLYRNKKIIVANGDIFFNYTLFYLCKYNLNNSFMALTRWDVTKDESLIPFTYETVINSRRYTRPATDSQDAWIFKSPLKPFNDSSRKLGTLHCDGKIAFQAKQAKCHVTNPCLSIQACHVHNSRVRHYGPEPDISDMETVNWGYIN